MSFVRQLFKLLGLELEDLGGALRRDAFFAGALVVLLAIALVFGLVALHLGLSALWGPIISALVIALGALVIALVLYGIKAAGDRARARRAAAARLAAERNALVSSAAIGLLPVIAETPVLRKAALPLGGALAAAWLLFRHKPGPAAAPSEPGPDAPPAS